MCSHPRYTRRGCPVGRGGGGGGNHASTDLIGPVAVGRARLVLQFMAVVGGLSTRLISRQYRAPLVAPTIGSGLVGYVGPGLKLTEEAIRPAAGWTRRSRSAIRHAAGWTRRSRSAIRPAAGWTREAVVLFAPQRGK